MTQESQERSKIPPLLVAALICDAAVEEPHSKKKSLIGIFQQIFVSTFPTVREATLYFKIADAFGYYDIELKFVNADTNSVLTRGTGSMVVDDRLESPDFLIPLSRLPIKQPGRYELQIWANKMFIGQAFIDAMELPTTPNVVED